MAKNTGTMRAFIGWGAVQSFVLAFVSIFIQESWTTSAAYSWVFAIVPLPVMTLIWAVQAGVAAWLWWNSRSNRDEYFGNYFFVEHSLLTTAWLAWFTLIQFMFAWSIFTLTWQGSPGAIAGSLQWGGLAVVGWLLLRRD